MSRRLGSVVVALCVMLAVAGCSSRPPGAKETVRELAALDIVTTQPPQSERMAYVEDFGRVAMDYEWDPSVTVVYATEFSPDDVLDFYVTAFPEYRIHDSGGSPGRNTLGGDDRYTDVYITVTIDAPDYLGHKPVKLGAPPEGTVRYVELEVYSKRTDASVG